MHYKKLDNLEYNTIYTLVMSFSSNTTHINIIICGLIVTVLSLDCVTTDYSVDWPYMSYLSNYVRVCIEITYATMVAIVSATQHYFIIGLWFVMWYVVIWHLILIKILGYNS